MDIPATAGNDAAANSQTLVASAGKPEFVRAVGVPGRDGLGRMELFRRGSDYFAKDSLGTQYPLSYGVSEDEAVQRIRNTLGGGGYANAFGRSGGATGALSAQRPSAEVIDHRTGAIKSQARYDQTQHQSKAHPNQGSDHVSALKNTLAGYASGGLGATDLRQAMQQARVALANPTALGADSRRYLQDFHRQGQGKLQASDAQAQTKVQAQAQARLQAAEAGDAAVRKLGEAIGAFDRGAGRDTLNAALAQARRADKSGWTAAQQMGFKAYEGQASTRLWPKANPQLAPNERALARDGAAKAREQRGQQQAKAPPRVADVNTPVGAQAPNGQGLQGDLVRINDRQWGLKGSTSLYRVPEHIQDKQAAIAYAKQQIQAGGWSQLRALDPNFLGGGTRDKQTAQYIKPFRERIDIASAEVTDGERVWDQLSDTKNQLQRFGDLAFGDGFARYDETRNKLSSIFDQVVNRLISREAGSAQIKSVMAQYRRGHAKQIEGFGVRAETGAVAVQAVDSGTNLLLNATVQVATKGNGKAGFAAEVAFRTFKDGVASKVHAGSDLAQYTNAPLSKERVAENVFGAAGNTIFLKTLDPRALVGPLLGKGAVSTAVAGNGLLPTIGKAFGTSRFGQAAAAGTTLVAASVSRMPFDAANTAVQTSFQAADMRALVDKARSAFPNERERELRQAGAQLERSRGTQLRSAAGEFDKAKAQQLSKLESSWNAEAEGVIVSELAKLPAAQRPAAEQQLRARLAGLRQQAVAQEAQAFERGWRDEQGREVYPGRARFLALAAKDFDQWKKQELQRQRLAMNTNFDTWVSKTNTQADQMISGIPRAVMQQAWETAKRLPIDFIAGAAMGALPNALKPMSRGEGWLQRYTLDPKLYLHETLASAVTSGAGQVVINAAEGKPLGTHVDQAIAQGAINLPIVHNTSKLLHGASPRASGQDGVNTTPVKPPYNSLPDSSVLPRGLDARPSTTLSPTVFKASPNKPTIDTSGTSLPFVAVDATPGKQKPTPPDATAPLPGTNEAITREQQQPVTQRPIAEPTRVDDISALRDTKRQALAALKDESLTSEQREQLTTTVRQADVALAKAQERDGSPVASRRIANSDVQPTPESVVDFFDRYLPGHGLGNGTSREQQIDAWSKAPAQEVRLDDNGNVIAAAVGMIDSRGRGLFDLLVVAPGHRTPGLSQELVKSIEDQLAARGVTTIRALPAANSSSAERALVRGYRLLGYKPELNAFGQPTGSGYYSKTLTRAGQSTPTPRDRADAESDKLILTGETSPRAGSHAGAPPVEPGRLIAIATSTGVSEGWLADPTSVFQTNTGPVYRATRTFERDVSWQAIQDLQKQQPNESLKGLNPNNALSFEPARDVRIRLPDAGSSGTTEWRVRGPSADGRGLALAREEVKHYKLQADGRAMEVRMRGPVSEPESQLLPPDWVLNAQEYGLRPNNPRGPPDWDGINSIHTDPPEERDRAEPETDRSNQAPEATAALSNAKKQPVTQIVDAGSSAQRGVVNGWYRTMTTGTANVDAAGRAAGQVLLNNPLTQALAPVTNTTDARPRNPLTPIAQAIQAFGKTPLGKAVQLSPLLALTASGRLPPGVSFDAQVEQRMREMAEQLLQTTQQQEAATGQQQAPKDAQPTPGNGTQTWSTVNQAKVDQPVTLQQPADPRDPTLIDHLNLDPREPGRAYNDVLSIASKPFYGGSSVLFVPNAVTEQGVGIKGNGANPKDWGAGFFRGFSFTVQPLEVFASRTFALTNARQSVQSSALRVQVSHAGGDYFSTGVHQVPSATGGVAVDNLFNSKRSVTSNFGEAFGNFPYAWTRPDTNTVGGRVIGQRGEIIFNSVEGLRRDNASAGQSIYQGGAPYSWAQDNVKFSLGTNPWSGYAYIGAQQELGVKVAGAGREQDAPGALPTSNWHLVGGRIVDDTSANRAAWERSFDSSGLTLRSESLVPAIGEKTAAVFARVDDKLLAAGDLTLPVRTIDGRDYVRASDVYARLAAAGRSVAGYDELSAVQPRQFIDINRDVSRTIDGQPFIARDIWVRTGTVVAEGLPGLAVPKAYAQPSPGAVYGAPQTAFARTELPAQKLLPTFGVRGVLDAPSGRTPPAPITPGQLANDAAQRTNWKIDGTSRAAQVVAIGAALRDVDAAQQHYEQLMREGKNWLQKNIDAGRDLVWGAPDAQISNFEQRRTELNALLGQVGEGLTRGADASRVVPNTPRVQAELDRTLERYKGEYRRVFDEQLRNAQIAQALWFASRGVVLSAAAAAALGAVTVGVKRNRLGPMLMGGVVGLTAASVFDAGSLLIGKTGPAGNSHFAPRIHLQSPGAYVMGRMTGDAPGNWGPAAQKGLQDLAQAAAITFGIRLRASLDKRLIEATEKHLGTTGAIGAVLNRGPKELLDGRGGAPFWIKGLSADVLRFGGTAGMSLLQGLTGDFVNAGFRAAPAALFDPTRLYGGADGKLAVAGRQVTAQVADGLQRNLFRAGASGVTNVLNFRRGGEWFDGAANVLTTLFTGAAADQADGGIGRTSAATIAPDALAQTVENIGARYVPKALDPERFVEPQSAAFYARKFGVPEHTIRFLITNRHGQSGANLLHVTAGNTVVAEAQPLGKQGLFDPSLHWLGQTAAQVRDAGLYGAAAKGLNTLKYTLAGVDAPRLASDEDASAALQHPVSTDIGVIARQGNKAVTTLQMADALGLRETGESDADVQQRLEAAIREAAGQIWERQLSANSHGFNVRPETWENYNVPLTRQGQTQALRGQKTITALLGHLGDRPIDVSVSPVLRAKLTAQLLFGDAKATFPERFDGLGDMNVQIRWAEEPGARERGQGYLVYSAKVGVEFGKGESGWETLKAGNPLMGGDPMKWWQGARKGVLDNLAGNMGWPPPSAAGKQSQVIEFSVPIQDRDGQVSLNTRNVRVRLRDATGYETSRQFDRRVKQQLLEGSILPTFKAGFDAVNVSHQYTIAALMRELQASRLNPLFKQDTKAVGAAVINGKPHMTVFYMDETGTPRLLEAGYVDDKWAAKQDVQRLQAVDVSRLERNSPQRLAHETELVRAVVQRDVLLDSPNAMRRLEAKHALDMRTSSSTPAVFDHLQKLDVLRTALRRIDAWAPQETLRWNEDIQLARRLFPSRGAVPASLQPEALALRVSTLMSAFQPDVAGHARHNYSDTRRGLENLQREITQAIGNTSDASLRARLEKVRGHVWYLYEQIGDPTDALAQVHQWREDAARGRDVR